MAMYLDFFNFHALDVPRGSQKTTKENSTNCNTTDHLLSSCQATKAEVYSELRQTSDM